MLLAVEGVQWVLVSASHCQCGNVPTGSGRNFSSAIAKGLGFCVLP